MMQLHDVAEHPEVDVAPSQPAVKEEPISRFVCHGGGVVVVSPGQELVDVNPEEAEHAHIRVLGSAGLGSLKLEYTLFNLTGKRTCFDGWD